MMTIFRDKLLWSGFSPIFDPITDLDVLTELDFLPNCKMCPWNICIGCGIPTEDAYSSGHLVLSHFGTFKCSNVETNLSWTCLVSGLLSLEHPSVLPFCLYQFFFKLPQWDMIRPSGSNLRSNYWKSPATNNKKGRRSGSCLIWGGLDKSRHIVPPPPC